MDRKRENTTSSELSEKLNQSIDIEPKTDSEPQSKPKCIFDPTSDHHYKRIQRTLKLQEGPGIPRYNSPRPHYF